MLDVHYLSMPESSIEVHPRPVSYYNGDSRNHRKSLTSAELNVDSKIHRDDNPQTNWRDAFNGKVIDSHTFQFDLDSYGPFNTEVHIKLLDL